VHCQLRSSTPPPWARVAFVCPRLPEGALITHESQSAVAANLLTIDRETRHTRISLLLADMPLLHSSIAHPLVHSIAHSPCLASFI
jgi:hypothetical protein